MMSSEQNPEECDPSTSTSFPIIIGTTLLLSKEQKDERSVATDDAQGTKAGYIKKASITMTEAFKFFQLCQINSPVDYSAVPHPVMQITILQV